MRVKAYQYQELTTELIHTLTKTGHNAVSWSYNCLASAMQHAYVHKQPILQIICTQIRLLLRSSLIRFKLFASMKKSILKCTWMYAADVKGRHFQD